MPEIARFFGIIIRMFAEPAALNCSLDGNVGKPAGRRARLNHSASWSLR